MSWTAASRASTRSVIRFACASWTSRCCRRGPMGETFAAHGVRYQVTDVTRAASFYTAHLGFTLTLQHPPAFAMVMLGDLPLLLTGPGASGSRPLPGGVAQRPGGWNRLVLRVANLSERIAALKDA